MTAATTRTAPPDNDVLWARSLHYAHGGTPALAGVSLGVAQGEILAVLGPRGSGKTTLLKCLSGQLLPQQGEVWFNSGPVHTLSVGARERLRRDRFGWIGTRPELVPELTAWENVALPLLLAGDAHRVARRAAMEWLERLDAGDIARCRPAVLPQQQRQHVAIARALVAGPDVVFADEPTAPLRQAEGVQALRTLVAAARSHGISVVLAGPEGDAATAGAADRTFALVDGRRAGGARTAAEVAGYGDGAAATGTEAGAARPAGAPGPAGTTENAEDSCSVSA
ncbi:ABC transporter ATP-binding protein [Streptomyces sp. WAC 06738]|uniref:ABC transporter ATP-binding protein n=1 Tax=Streptomyces sp. WAC 06738 TaxID=2203210 RepID=UPI000F702A81|nr:ATP-binding cassette domain-containing protein [Streptomyces sp. WAC 06738]AZM49035.1 ABC transporter ATP-binding protein [Streptomyces sp. WAC 06738]